MAAEPETISTALTPIERAKVALNSPEHEKRLAELAKASVSITEITNAAGYQQCHAARMSLKKVRVEIEKIGKAAREDATKFSKAVIAEQQRLIDILAPEETRLEGIQRQWDEAREREKKALEEAERQRIAAIEVRIDQIRQAPLSVDHESKHIELVIGIIEGVAIDESFAELRTQAGGAKATALIRLRALQIKSLAFEDEQKRLKKAHEENERIRLANEAAAEAERKRIAEDRHRAQEQADRERAEAAERERIARELLEKEAARLAEEARQHQLKLDAENECIRAQQAKDIQTERQRLEAEETALQARIAAQEIEREIRERERAEADEAQRAEAQRLADERTQLERDQEALRAEQEKPSTVTVPLQSGEPMIGAPTVLLPPPGDEEVVLGITPPGERIRPQNPHDPDGGTPSSQETLLPALEKAIQQLGHMGYSTSALAVREAVHGLESQRSTIEFVSKQIRSMTPDWNAVIRWLDEAKADK